MLFLERVVMECRGASCGAACGAGCGGLSGTTVAGREAATEVDDVEVAEDSGTGDGAGTEALSDDEEDAAGTEGDDDGDESRLEGGLLKTGTGDCMSDEGMGMVV